MYLDSIITLILSVLVFPLVLIVAIRIFMATRHKSMLLVSYGAAMILINHILNFILYFLMENNLGLPGWYNIYYILWYVLPLAWLCLAVGLLWYFEYSRKVLVVHRKLLLSEIYDPVKNIGDPSC